MSIRRPLFYILVTTFALGVLFEAMIVPKEETWPERLQQESRRVEDRRLRSTPAGMSEEEQKAEIRKAAQAQWNLAEWYYARGDYDTAQQEYERYIQQFPYVELDYGYRTDDARKRILDIQEARAQGRGVTGHEP